MSDMKVTQKGFIVPLLIIIIAVLILGGGLYVYQRNKQSDSTQTSNTSTSIGKPIVTSVKANMSTIGLLMTITGHGFTTESNVIYIDDTVVDNGQPRSSDSNQIYGAFPIPGAVGSSHTISITNENGVSNSLTFTIQAGAKTTDPRYPL